VKVTRTPLKAVLIMLSNARSEASSSPAAPAMTIPTRQKKKGISWVAAGPVDRPVPIGPQDQIVDAYLNS
jgi:hypothetical protein